MSSAVASPMCHPASLPEVPRPRVVVVDDERSIREIWGHILSASGYDVECFADAASALPAIDAGCDCVLTDYHMPEMNGVELMRRAARGRSRVNFILMTGNPSDEVSKDAFSAGASYVLHKPTNPPAVLEKLAKLTQQN